MNKRVSLLILILKPFARLYKILAPKGGHKGFAYFTGSFAGAVVAVSVLGSILARNNIKNSIYNVADAQNTSDSNEDITENTTIEYEEKSETELSLSEQATEQVTEEAIASSAQEEEDSLYLFSQAPNTGDDSDGLTETTAEDTGSYALNINEAAENWYEMFSVDFEYLQSINSDIIGWIVWENEDISYPLLYSGDNSKYLSTSFDGRELSSGSIFLDGRNDSSFSDQHNIIYGHNMKNLSMFGKLKYYKTDDSYYSEHQYIQILLPDRTERYQIFSFNTVSSSSIVYNVDYTNSEEIEEFLNYIELASYTATGIDVDSEDKILSLSTCTADEDKRFVINAVLVDEK